MKWRNIHIQTPFPPRAPTQNILHKKYTPARSDKGQNLSINNSKNNSQDRFDTSFENSQHSQHSRLSKNSNNSQQKQRRSSLEHITNKSNTNKLELSKNKEQGKTKIIQKKMKRHSQQKKYIVTEDWIIRLKIQINKLLKCSQSLTGIIKNHIQMMSKELRNSHQKLKQEMIKRMVDITYQIAMMNVPTFSEQNISPQTNKKLRNNGSMNQNQEHSTINIEIDQDLFSPIKIFNNNKFITDTKQKTDSNNKNNTIVTNTNTNTNTKNNINSNQHHENGYSNVSITNPGTQTTLKQLVKPFTMQQYHDEEFGSSLMNIQQSQHPQSPKRKHCKNSSQPKTNEKLQVKDRELKPPLLSPIMLSQKQSQLASQLHLQSNQKLKQSCQLNNFGGRDLILEYSNAENQDNKIQRKQQSSKQKLRKNGHLRTKSQMESTLTNLNQCIDNMKRLLANPL